MSKGASENKGVDRAAVAGELPGQPHAPPERLENLSARAAKLLVGAIEFHVHASPDVRERKWSYSEVVRHSAQAGMAAVVLKSHHTITADLASLLQEEYNADIDVVGGIALNHAVGGFNPYAVQTALSLGGRIVWFPTLDAANQLRYDGRPVEQGITIYDDRGSLRPEVQRILAMIAEKDAVLCTGHLASEEILRVTEEARREGVSRIVVNHPEHVCLALDVTLQKQLSQMGALLERCYPRDNCITDMTGLARIIREVGVESSLLGTDLGQLDQPDPVTGMGLFVDGLVGAGFSERELRYMTHDLPSGLLDQSSGAGAEKQGKLSHRSASKEGQ